MITKWKIDPNTLKITYRPNEDRAACYRYEVWEFSFTHPIGIAYLDCFGSEKGTSTAALTHIYVLELVRRQGIATKLIQNIQEHYKIITTCSNKYSKGLLKKMGFVYSDNTEEWVWKKETPEK